MLDDAIREFLAARRGEHLARLKEFIRFPSVSAQSDHQGDCLACARWLAERLGGAGLTAEVDESPGRPVVLAAGEQRPDRPTLLVYGHYDVQPPDPLELWDSPPFEPTERDGDLVGRGASDDKGPLLTWLAAAEAYHNVAGEAPVNLKVLVEGEEELGSPTLAAFIQSNAERLRCHHAAISDTAFHADGVPSITYGLRGLMYVEVTLAGPGRDLHSGLYGGVAVNPISALATLLGGLHDENGRVTIPGFYDAVEPITPSEHVAFERLAFDEDALKADLGTDALAGEKRYTPLERLWARPALDVNGIWGGYAGEGPKTVIPAIAGAKLSARLVCSQSSDAVIAGLREYLQAHRPPGTRVDMKVLSAEEPWLVHPGSPALVAARAAMAEAFEADCALIRCGASVPVTSQLQAHLGVDALMMGYGLPDDRVHSPNEKFRIEHLYRGALASASLMARLAEL